ncbi:MAG: DUF4126 domain-containing protein [Planctomycetaceae bacterium]|nr:DUF4126 domain-containing protein [Planctomycetaceae bacterium]
MESFFSIILSCLIGVSLAAACGFRIFVPLLVMGIAVKSGQLQLADGWDWIGSWPALSAFAIASVTEFAGFLIPGFDNILDTIATPAAIVAGTIATAACVSEMDPLLQWSTAIIAGGGAAAVVQGATVVARGASTVTTAGLGNSLVAVSELVMSFVLSVLAVVAPILAGLMLCVVGFFVIRRLRRRRAKAALPLSI